MRTRRRGSYLAFLGFGALVTAACVGDGEWSGTLAAFPGSASSLQQLGRGTLAALQTGDVESLERFRLTEEEHNEVVWPELPASAPEVNFPVELAWGNIRSRNYSAIRRIGSVYEVLEARHLTTECRGGTERFETFVVLTDCWVLLEVEGETGPLEAQLFKDVLLRNGGYKVFRYYDGEPRPRRVFESASRMTAERSR